MSTIDHDPFASATLDPAVHQPHSAPAPAARRWRPTRRHLVTLLALLLLAGGAAYGYDYWQWAALHESTDDAMIDAHIAQVSAKVPGHIARVCIDDNQLVKTGDLLLELDPRDYDSAVAQAQAKLAAAEADVKAYDGLTDQTKATIDSAEADVAQAQAQLASDQAELEHAKADYESYAAARKNGVVSPTEWQKIETAVQTRQAACNAAGKTVLSLKAKVAAARATLAAVDGKRLSTQALVTQARAALESARLNQSYTRVFAAQDGRITRKSIEVGNYITPGQPLAAIVAPDLWVTANFKETQLTHMHPGQHVDISVDAYPGLALHGRIDSIQAGTGARFSLLPPENATGNYVKVVQRVPVKITLATQPDPAHPLGPGMSVEPIVTVR